MKKHLLKSLLALALVLITGNAWGETYSFTFANGDLTTSSKSVTKNKVTWALTATEDSWDGTSNKSGYRFGSASSTKNLTISTSDILGTITKITVTGRSNNSGKTAAVSVKVGATDFNGTTTTWDNGNNQALTFTGSASGQIAVTITPTACGYIFSGISVEYTPSTKTLTSIAISGAPTKTAYEEGEEFDPAGLIVTGTYDDASTNEITSGIEWTINPSGALTLGTTSVSVTAKVEDFESEPYNVNVTVTEKPALPSYTLVTDASTLKDGDAIVLGAVKDGTWYVNGGHTDSNKYLDSKEATFTDDVLESEGAVEITLEETTGGWYLKIGEEYINTTAAKALTFADEASTAWTIEIDEAGIATIAAGDYGRFLYNASSPRFLNYTSDTNVSMILPSIFKKEASLPETFNVEISAAGFATLYLEFAATIPTDVTAYTATYAEKTITLHEIEGGVIPAETAVVLKGEAGDYDFVETVYTGEPLENALCGTTEESSYEMLQGTETDKYVYTLNQGDNGVGFFHMTNSETSKLAANRAYLLIPKADFADGAGTIGFRFGDATQIENMNAVEAGKYFDLQGREVLTPAGGIYILNGKKVLVK